MSCDPPVGSEAESSLRGKWLRVGLLLALVLSAAPLLTPAYRSLKTWRAHRFLAEAEGFVRNKDLQSAFGKIQAAYLLASQEPSVIRFAARIYTLARHPQAIQFWRQLVEHPSATAKDEFIYVELSLMGGDWNSATPVMARWVVRGKLDDARLLMAARYYDLRGDRESALAYAIRASETLRLDDAAELFVVRLLLGGNSDGGDQDRLARSRLWRLVDGNGAASIEAISILGRREDLTAAEAAKLIQRLSEHPGRRLREEMLANDLRIRFEPQRRLEVVAATGKRFEGGDLEQRLEVSRWLNRHKDYERTVLMISRPEALKSREAFMVRLDALAAMDRWKEVGEELKVEPCPIEPVLREVFLARVAKELGDSGQAEVHWRRAHLEAGQTPQALQYLAQYAERVGARSDAVEAFRRLTTIPGKAREGYVELVRVANQDRNTRMLRDLLREMRRAFPEDTSVENDWAYVSLLLKEDIEEAKSVASGLVARSPTLLPHRTTLALAYLRSSEIHRAKKLYEGVSLDWTLVGAGMQAVHAAVHGSSGNEVAAREFAEKIPLERLKPEERELIQRWLP